MVGALLFSSLTSSAQRNRQSNDTGIPVVRAESKRDSTKKSPQCPVSIEQFITKEAGSYPPTEDGTDTGTVCYPH